MKGTQIPQTRSGFNGSIRTSDARNTLKGIRHLNSGESSNSKPVTISKFMDSNLDRESVKERLILELPKREGNKKNYWPGAEK